MGRTHANGLELTWKPYGKRKGLKVKGGQWVKKVNGKQKSFGTAPNKSNRKSYETALATYKAFVAEQSEDERVKKMARMFFKAQSKAVGVIVEQEAEAATEDGQPAWKSWTLDPEQEVDPLNPPGPSLDDVVALVARRQHAAAQLEKAKQADASQGEQAFSSLIDLYLEHRRKDRDQTEKLPNAIAKSRQLSQAGYRSIENHLNTFRTFAGDQAVSDLRQVEDTLTAYRDMLAEQIISGQYTAHTVNTKLAKLRTFIKWIVARHHLEHMPANLTEISASFKTQKSGKPLSLEVIQKLWAHANARMRAWMAVSLNTGAYPGDVAKLAAEHLRDGRIIRRRHKTGVPANHKLWKVTQQLIKQTRQDKDLQTNGLLWVTQNGKPLSDTNRDTLGQLFKKLCNKAGVQATWSQFRDTSAQHVEGISRRNGKVDPALVSLFLAHRDQRTAAYYLSDDPADLETGTLDKALDELEKIYDLKLDASATL